MTRITIVINESTDIEDCKKEGGDHGDDGSLVEDRNNQGQVIMAEENLGTFSAVGKDLQSNGLTQNGEGVLPVPNQPTAVKRPRIKSTPSENVLSSTPAMKRQKVRGLSLDPEQCQMMKSIKSGTGAGPSVAGSQAINRIDLPSSEVKEDDEATYIVDCSMEGGENGAEGSIMEDRSNQWFDLPEGWRKQIITRKSGSKGGRHEAYVWPPFGKKLRSNKDILQWVHNNPDQPINPMFVNTGVPINPSGEVIINSNIQKHIDDVQGV